MSAEAALSDRPATVPSRLLMSGNAVWEAGVRVAAAYPGTPATEMLECVATYPGIYAEWSDNEKVSLEVAFGAAMAGSRSFCAMKHVGMNVASDALMTMTLTGVAAGLVIAIADDVGLSSCRPRRMSRIRATGVVSRTYRCSNPPTRRKRTISRWRLLNCPSASRRR